jgi:hypothetical protein
MHSSVVLGYICNIYNCCEWVIFTKYAECGNLSQGMKLYEVVYVLKTLNLTEVFTRYLELYRTSRVKGSQPAEQIRRNVKRRNGKSCA